MSLCVSMVWGSATDCCTVVMTFEFWYFHRVKRSRTKRSGWWWVIALGLCHRCFGDAEVDVLLAGITVIDIRDGVSPDIFRLFSILYCHIWTEKASPANGWLLIGSRPAPTFIRPAPTFLHHLTHRHQNAGLWLTQPIKSQHFGVDMGIHFHPQYYLYWHPDPDTSWTDAGFKSGLDRVLIAARFKRYMCKLCIFDLMSFLLVFRVKSGSKNLSPMQEYTSIKFSDDGKYFKSTLFHWVWWHFLCQSNNKGYGNMECRL